MFSLPHLHKGVDLLQILSRANHLLRFCQKRREREREKREIREREKKRKENKKKGTRENLK